MKDLKGVLSEVKRVSTQATLSENNQSLIRGKHVPYGGDFSEIRQMQNQAYKRVGWNDKHTKMQLLGFTDPNTSDDGFQSVDELTWKQFKEYDAPYYVSKKDEDEFIKRLMSQVKQFNQKIELNSDLKKMDDFSQKVEHLLKSPKIKFNKKGI